MLGEDNFESKHWMNRINQNCLLSHNHKVHVREGIYRGPSLHNDYTNVYSTPTHNEYNPFKLTGAKLSFHLRVMLLVSSWLQSQLLIVVSPRSIIEWLCPDFFCLHLIDETFAFIFVFALFSYFAVINLYFLFGAKSKNCLRFRTWKLLLRKSKLANSEVLGGCVFLEGCKSRGKITNFKNQEQNRNWSSHRGQEHHCF